MEILDEVGDAASSVVRFNFRAGSAAPHITSSGTLRWPFGSQSPCESAAVRQSPAVALRHRTTVWTLSNLVRACQATKPNGKPYNVASVAAVCVCVCVLRKRWHNLTYNLVQFGCQVTDGCGVTALPPLHAAPQEYVLFAKTRGGKVYEVVELLDTHASNEQHAGNSDVGVPPAKL